MDVTRSDVLQYWRAVLELFDWPEYRIDALIRMFERDIEDETSLFSHESLAYYVAWELLTEQTELPGRLKPQVRIPKDRWEIPCGLQRIIEQRVKWSPERGSFQADWGALRKEILAFLEEYGSTISVRRPTW